MRFRNNRNVKIFRVYLLFLFKEHLNKVFVIDIQIWDFFLQIFFSNRQRQYPPTKKGLPAGFPKHRNFLQELEEKSSFQSVSSHGWNQCPSIHVDGIKDSLKYIVSFQDVKQINHDKANGSRNSKIVDIM